MKATNISPSNPRIRGSSHSMAYFFLVLLLIASLSFFQTVHMINTHDNGHVVKESLDSFVKQRPKHLTLTNYLSSIDEKEEAIPNPIIADGNATFSACLLVMDDNHRLVEWMAYHYHVLPLRYLVVAVDPRSQTSPTKVLNRWRRMGVFIEEWDDFKFMKKDIAKNKIGDDEELQVKRDRHRMRQKKLYVLQKNTFVYSQLLLILLSLLLLFTAIRHV